jgi:excinuclease UvrABC nuclease subunit
VIHRISGRRRFEEAALSDSPDEPGVYSLFRGGTLIYVGPARRRIRARLRAHQRGEQGPCTQRADEFQWETTSRPTDRARAILIVHQTRTGRLPSCNDRVP